MSKSYIKSLLVVGVTALFASAGCGAQIMDNGPTSSCQVASDCSPTQNCVSGTCVAKTPVNPPECKGDDGCKGKPGTICHKGACVTATECDAGRPCADPTKQFCDNGYCRQIESCASNPEICGDGRICVKNECLATTGCKGSDECKPTERCKEGACIDITGKTDLCKLGFLSCGAGYRCEFNNCVPNCNDPCGGKCCGTAEVCYKDTCVMPCGVGEEMCGTATAPVCCNTSTHGCFGGQCKPLGVACDESAGKYCTIVRYCDAKYASCVKYSDATDLCLLPTVDEFELEVKLYYGGNDIAKFGMPPSVEPNYNQSIRTPIIADVTGPAGVPDGKPDMIVNMYEVYGGKGILRVISGTAGSGGPKDVTEYWHSVSLANAADQFWTESEMTPAVGDLDGDKKPDIVVQKSDGKLIAVRGGDGSRLWTTDSSVAGWWPAVAIADLDYDGKPEVLYSSSIINGQTGKVLCNVSGSATLIAADLDEKGNMEIVSGGTTYSFERISENSATCKIRPMDPADPTSSPSHAGQFAAVADVDDRFHGPEIAVISGGKLYLLNSRGKEIWQYPLPGGSAGPPTIGDFDGDEKLEIAFADSSAYMIVKPVYDPGTNTYTVSELCHKTTKDASSGVTGSSIFDFDGDGKAEAVYYDENYLRIYNGADGALKLKDQKAIPNSSLTDIEYPLVVDVDADGHADIVAVSNEGWSGTGFRGVRVFTDKHNRWVPTRKIWNQHTYHYTNVNDDGTIPTNEKHHWKEAWSNTFRQNVQKGNNRLAPDITVKFASLFGASCNASTQRTLRYTIRNEGDKEVAAGAITNVLSVRKTGTTTYDVLDSRTNTQKLAPGDSELVTFDWNIPTKYQSSNLDFKVEADHGNAIIECREDNTAENLNVAVASPNLSVNLNQSFACSASSSGFSTPINFELSNSGAVAVPAGKAEVTIQFKKSDGTVVKEVKIKNTEEIPAQGYINMNSTVDFSLSSSSNIISLDLVISVKLAPGITECSEADNEISKAGAVICYSFG